jgi:hypothetical protein
VIERAATVAGGHVLRIENYLGFCGISRTDPAWRAPRTEIRREIITAGEVVGVAVEDPAKMVTSPTGPA